MQNDNGVEEGKPGEPQTFQSGALIEVVNDVVE